MVDSSFYVAMIKPADEKFKEMKMVYDACEKAKVKTPKEVAEFFNYEKPDEKGVILYHAAPEGMVEEVYENGIAGIDINVSEIPKDVKIVRVYHSY